MSDAPPNSQVAISSITMDKNALLEADRSLEIASSYVERAIEELRGVKLLLSQSLTASDPLILGYEDQNLGTPD